MQNRLDPRFLYRGVNSDLYHLLDGRLTPKALGQKFERAVYFGEDVYFNDGSTFGVSEQNAVIMHQRDSSKYPSAGVSTTPIFENAVRYATHQGKYNRGYVYKIDTQLLTQYGVTPFSVDQYAVQPAIPDDHEVILVAGDFSALPKEIIIEVIEVPSSSPSI